jgi:hypothetical protein
MWWCWERLVSTRGGVVDDIDAVIDALEISARAAISPTR